MFHRKFGNIFDTMKNSSNVFIQWVHNNILKNTIENKIVFVFFSRLGCPRPHKTKVVNNWPCNPEKTIVRQIIRISCLFFPVNLFRLRIFQIFEKSLVTDQVTVAIVYSARSVSLFVLLVVSLTTKDVSQYTNKKIEFFLKIFSS